MDSELDLDGAAEALLLDSLEESVGSLEDTVYRSFTHGEDTYERIAALVTRLRSLQAALKATGWD